MSRTADRIELAASERYDYRGEVDRLVRAWSKRSRVPLELLSEVAGYAPESLHATLQNRSKLTTIYVFRIAAAIRAIERPARSERRAA